VTPDLDGADRLETAHLGLNERDFFGEQSVAPQGL
jgi:hypothetical protein